MKNTSYHALHPSNRRIASSLFLQVLLHYNVFYSMLWFVGTWTHLIHKYKKGIGFVDPDIVRTIFLVLWMLAEPVRLWAAYQGNLKEKVPWMAVAFLLTCFPQMPSCFYLLVAQKDNQSMDKALNLVMAIFLLPEILLFLPAMRRMIKIHQQQFYLHDFSQVVNPMTAVFEPGKDHYSVACEKAFQQETTFRSRPMLETIPSNA